MLRVLHRCTFAPTLQFTAELPPILTKPQGTTALQNALSCQKVAVSTSGKWNNMANRYPRPRLAGYPLIHE